MGKFIHFHNDIWRVLLPHVQDVLLLIMRLYIAWIFLRAGLLKIDNWAATQYLFQFEYQVPLLSWQVAAVLGTVTELIVPLFILSGFFTRVFAGILFVFNAVAVMAYPVLWQDGFVLLAKGAMDHQIWGVMILVVIMFGAGKWGFDRRLGIS